MGDFNPFSNAPKTFLALLLYAGIFFVFFGIVIGSKSVTFLGELSIGTAIILWILQHKKSLGLP
jgi:hypothetical protein